MAASLTKTKIDGWLETSFKIDRLGILYKKSVQCKECGQIRVNEYSKDAFLHQNFFFAIVSKRLFTLNNILLTSTYCGEVLNIWCVVFTKKKNRKIVCKQNEAWKRINYNFTSYKTDKLQ